MTLAVLQTTSFRNLQAVDLEFNVNCNLFHGDNGSGKTSFLEAIYYLGLCKSFRSHYIKRIVNHASDKFSIFGKVKVNEVLIPLGVERSSLASGENQIKVGGKYVTSASELAKFLPLQLLNQDLFHFFEHGPKARRQFMDWGLFHVEPKFISLWKSLNRILEQRNAALRQNLKTENIKAWDEEFVRLGIELHAMRQHYVEALIPIINLMMSSLLENVVLQIKYERGWENGLGLWEVLDCALSRDRQVGYTTQGPHRADLLLKVNGGVPVQDFFSRGQQKLLLFVMKLAQGIFLAEQAGKRCIYLIDDLPAELDKDKRQSFVDLLTKIGAQIFVTGLSKVDLRTLFAANDYKMFHVEQGAIR